MGQMLCLIMALWMQVTQPLQPVTPFPKLESTVATLRSDPPRQGLSVSYHDDHFLFVSAANPDLRKQQAGLFVHSMALRRWREITAVSTAGGRFGSSKANNEAEAKRLSTSMVGWDFTMYAHLPAMPLPLRTSGSFVLPDDISYDEKTDLYEMKMLSSWRVPSAETVVYVRRQDLVEQFAKDQR
jgi:hypothetical protein